MSRSSTEVATGNSSNSNAKIEPSQSTRARIVQNFRVIWLGVTIDEVKDKDLHDNITQLRRIFNSIDVFIDANHCIPFLNDIKDEMVFLVVTNYFGECITPIIHNMPQLDSIYILCGNKSKNEQWIKEWFKIRGVFTEISSICDALKKATWLSDQNSISISFMSVNDNPSNQNLDQLDPSFMYTEILKEILLSIDFDDSHITEFIDYCRKNFSEHATDILIIDDLERSYKEHSPIWWYTQDSFLYSMLNRALRQMDVDILITMGFYVSDLHRQIKQLHFEQCKDYWQTKPFILYRGQRLLAHDFNRLLKKKGGLISFNNFLSTTRDLDTALIFAPPSLAEADEVGVLFVITGDPSLSTTPFASVGNLGHFEIEKEVLFSMHAVFRIDEIEQLEHHNRLWKTTLTVTNDNDQKLLALTKRIRDETEGYNRWYKHAMFLIKLQKNHRANELLEVLLTQTSKFTKDATIYNLLAITQSQLGQYSHALSFHEKTLGIVQETLPKNHPSLATSYNNIGQVYSDMGQYKKALSFYEKALGIYQETLPENHPYLATSYSNIGQVYSKLGDHKRALSFYEKALEIRKETLPENHPSLATSYSNIGQVYSKLGDYKRALSFYEKALGIRKETS